MEVQAEEVQVEEEGERILPSTWFEGRKDKIRRSLYHEANPIEHGRIGTSRIPIRSDGPGAQALSSTPYSRSPSWPDEGETEPAHHLEQNAYSSENDEQVPLSQYIEERGIQPDLEEPIDDVDEGRQEPSSRQPVSFQARDEDDSDLGLFEYLAGREVRGKSREIPETPRKRRLASRSPSRRPVKRRQATVFDLDYHNISDESEESSDPSPKQDREEDAYKDHNKESYEPRTLNPDEEFRAKLRDLEEAMSMLTLHDRREIPRRRSRGLFDNIHPGFRDRKMASMRYTVSRGGRVIIRKHLRDAIRCCHSCA
ncbi:hypothetical protein F5Y08DRAFT_351093 [Xylaria arbuscula]|nr:hypothetical protein F5Y08DRAFT_351093 [Xylaria arbuscula]